MSTCAWLIIAVLIVMFLYHPVGPCGKPTTYAKMMFGDNSEAITNNVITDAIGSILEWIIPAESMCGGIDQMCKCSGNETFIVGRNDIKTTKLVSQR